MIFDNERETFCSNLVTWMLGIFLTHSITDSDFSIDYMSTFVIHSW